MSKSKEKSTKRRGLASRKPADYDNEIHGRRENNAPPDDRTLNPKIACTLLRPRWKEGPMVGRAWPALDFENPENKLMPGRKSANPRGQNMWIIRMHTAAYVGLPDCPHYTFNLWHPSDKEAKAKNPWKKFYDACKKAYEAGEFASGRKWDSQWNRLMKGSKKGGAAITPPKIKWFVQGHCYVNGDTTYIDDDRELPLGLDEKDDLVCFQIPGSGGDGYLDLLDRRKSEFEGDEDETPWVAFKFGDPVGHFDPKKRIITGGTFFTIYNPSKTKIKKNSSFSGKIKDTQGYEAAIIKSIELQGKTFTPDMDSDAVQRVFDKAQFWLPDKDTNSEGLLYLPPREEQALWIAQAFKDIPKLVAFAFSESEELLTEEVKAVLKSRAQAVVPGADDDDKKSGKKSGKKTDKTQTSFLEDNDDDSSEEESSEEESSEEESSEEESSEEESSEEESSEEESSEEESSEEESSEEESSEEESSEEESSEEESSEEESSEEESSEEESSEEESSEEESSEEESSEEESSEEEPSAAEAAGDDKDEFAAAEKKDGKKDGKKSGKAKAGDAEKPKDDDEYFGAESQGKKDGKKSGKGGKDTDKSMKAAQEAKGRSKDRSVTPEPAPTPTAGKKDGKKDGKAEGKKDDKKGAAAGKAEGKASGKTSGKASGKKETGKTSGKETGKSGGKTSGKKSGKKK
jgi:hypothetical protein